MNAFRLGILRALMILSAPVTYVVFWLVGSPAWREEFWTSAGRLWRGDGRR